MLIEPNHERRIVTIGNGSQMSLDIIENTREELRKRELRLLGTVIFTATLFATGVTIAGFWELPQQFNTWESFAVYSCAAFVIQGIFYFTYKVTMQDKELQERTERHVQKLDELQRETEGHMERIRELNQELNQEFQGRKIIVLGHPLNEDVLPIELR